jgi:tRNA-Thr(GGU) m(6)t(6)A37 methyltransferase TsaA
MDLDGLQLVPIGHVESELVDRENAPRQPDEGAPKAWLVIAPEAMEGVSHVTVGDEVLVLTWLHRANREVLTVRPRGDPERPLTGVFSTRSPDRPNPIGLHRVRVLAIDHNRILADHLEAIDATPILDIKPVIAVTDR